MGDWLADALSSAHELARRRGQTPSTAHLLVALYRSESSVLSLGAQFGLRDAALAAELARRNHASTQRQSRLHVASTEHQREQARANGLWLGDEVEKRLPRRGARPFDRPPLTFADQVEAKLRRGH